MRCTEIQRGSDDVVNNGFYNDEYGGITADAILTPFFSVFPTLEYDNWVTIGIDSAPQGSGPTITINHWHLFSLGLGFQSFDYWSDFAGQDFTVNDSYGGGWFVVNRINKWDAYTGADNQRVLFIQLTASGSISGVMNAQIFPEGNGDNVIFQVIRL